MRMKYRVLIFIFIVPQCVSLSGDCPNLKNDVRSVRKRRYLMFPEGADVVLTSDFAKTFLTHVPSGWYVAMDLDVIFPLPGREHIRAFLRRKLHHRQKRELWERVKNALSLHNMDGHSCLLRTICEAKMYLAPPGKSLVHDLLRAIFSFEHYISEAHLVMIHNGHTSVKEENRALQCAPCNDTKRAYISEGGEPSTTMCTWAPVEEKEFAEEIGEGVFRHLVDPNLCDIVPECPFSLIHFILAFNKKKK